MADQGQAIAFFGSVASGTHPALSKLLGVSSMPHRPTIQDRMLRATAGAAWPDNVVNAGAFNAPPPARKVTAPTGSVVYAFGETAGLVLDQSGRRNLEEGLRDDPDRSRRMILNLPPAWRSCRWQSAWGIRPRAIGAAQVLVDLPPQESALFVCARGAGAATRTGRARR